MPGSFDFVFAFCSPLLASDAKIWLHSAVDIQKNLLKLNVLSKAVTELKCCVGGLDSHTAPRDFWPVSGASEDVFASLWTGWLLVSLFLAKFLFGTEDCLWSYWATVIFGPLKVETDRSTVSRAIQDVFLTLWIGWFTLCRMKHGVLERRFT